MTERATYDKESVILRLSTVNEFDLCVSINLIIPEDYDEVFIHEVISYHSSDNAISEATRWAKGKNYQVFLSYMDDAGEEIIKQL